MDENKTFTNGVVCNFPLYIFFLQWTENIQEAKNLLPLPVAGSCIFLPSQRLYWSPRLLEGEVSSSQRAIKGNGCSPLPAVGDPGSSCIDRAEMGNVAIFEGLLLGLVWVGLPSVRNEAGETLRWAWVFNSVRHLFGKPLSSMFRLWNEVVAEHLYFQDGESDPDLTHHFFPSSTPTITPIPVTALGLGILPSQHQ